MSIRILIFMWWHVVLALEHAADKAMYRAGTPGGGRLVVD